MPLSLFGIIVQASPCSHLFSTKTLVNGGKVCSPDSAVKRNLGLQIPVVFSGSYLPPVGSLWRLGKEDGVASETGTHGWSLWLLFNTFDLRVSTYSIPLALPSGPLFRLGHFWVSCSPREGLREWVVLPPTHLMIHLYRIYHCTCHFTSGSTRWDLPPPPHQDARGSVYQPRHFQSSPFTSDCWWLPVVGRTLRWS